MAKTKVKQFSQAEEVPERLSDIEVMYWVKSKEVDWSYVNRLKEYSSMTDEVISGWLSISVRTLRNYKKPGSQFKGTIKEHLLLLLSLYRHGAAVFGSGKEFSEWLNEENFFFDKQAPGNFLDTNSGIRHIDNSLTGMEYGDNA